MATIHRGRVQAYDAATHTATIELLEAPASTLENVPVLESIAAASMQVGDAVTVLLWSDIGAIVTGVYGGLPPAAAPVLVSGYVYDGTEREFTASDIDYPNLTLTLTLTATSHLWIHATLTGHPSADRDIGCHHTVYIDDTLVGPPGMANSKVGAQWATCTISFRTTGTYAAGNHTIHIHSHTHTDYFNWLAQFSSLSVIATPSGA